MKREMWEGNQAIAEAAVRAGLEAYFGYPITPQTEALEYLSRRMPELGRTFVQAESELGAINMVYGAACAGVQVPALRFHAAIDRKRPGAGGAGRRRATADDAADGEQRGRRARPCPLATWRLSRASKVRLSCPRPRAATTLARRRAGNQPDAHPPSSCSG